MSKNNRKKPTFDGQKHRRKRNGITFLFISSISALSFLFFFLLALLFFRKAGAQVISIEERKKSSPAGKSASFAEDAETIVLDQVFPLYQNPELPNGCEATSLCIALNTLGCNVDKLDVAYEIIPREDFAVVNGVYYAPDPELQYAGDPATNLGFYCLEDAVIEGSNAFFEQNNDAFEAVNLTGGNSDDLQHAVRKGFPLVLWTTIDYTDAATYHDSFTWQLPNGKEIVPLSNLHCVVLYGFDETSFFVCDPLEGELILPKEKVFASYEALGSHAVTFQKSSDSGSS